MSRLLEHWSYDPFLFVASVLALVRARGLTRRLRAVSRTGRPVVTTASASWLRSAWLISGSPMALNSNRQDWLNHLTCGLRHRPVM
jgi:hypothetical protein